MELIFVHGAMVQDGAWWWKSTADLLLEETGVESRAVALPSCGETGSEAASGGLVADADALRAALDSVDSAIVVGHSYGGTVIAETGSHPAVRSLIYVSSYLPDVGQTQSAIMEGEPDPVRVADNGDGTISATGYDALSFGARFLQDADAHVQQSAWERVTAQDLSAFTTPLSAAGWQGVDSTYIICGQDRSTSIELQRRHAARATRAVTLPTGHHPFVTHPSLMVAQIGASLRQDSNERHGSDVT